MGTGNGRTVLLFGQVRPGKGQRTVKVERQDPASGAWGAVRSWGPSCDEQDHSFMTDKAGFFLRGTAFTGPASYRLAWQRDGGGWEYGVAIPIAADGTQPPPV
jgi:hypothetical protein